MTVGKGIPKLLRNEVLAKTLRSITPSADFLLSNRFPSQNYESDTIRWAMEYGTAGMTPFVAPGSPAPTVGDEGMFSEGSARAAYWKEKMFIDEVMMNNLREPLTQSQRFTAERQLARNQNKLRNRCQRRREWMLAKMFFDGTFSYQVQGGSKFTVDYGIPSTHKVTLTGDDVWWDDANNEPGATATPIQDIYDARKTFVDDIGKEPTETMINSDLLRVLMFNGDLQTMLQESAFGNGDLFTRPAQVLGQLFGLGTLTVYDQIMEITAFLTQDVSSGATTLNIDDATDFESDETVRVYDLTDPFDYEEFTISSVDKTSDTITIDSGLSNSYKAGQAKIVMRKKFLPDNKLTMYVDTVEGESIAEFMNAPFGNDRNFGMTVDGTEEWDPDGYWIRVQNKGLPVLYNPDAIFTLTVK